MDRAKEQLVNELHSPARKKFPRRRVIIKGLDETWQGDIVEMIPYASVNNDYKYMLTMIDNFSKYAWAIPIKSKSADNVVKAVSSIFSTGRVPQKLHTDFGKEFYNSKFQNLLSKYNIHHYSTYSNLKASIIERFNRTLKEKMWRRFSLQGSYKWLEILPDLVRDYNNSFHRTIKMKPIEVNGKNEKRILNTRYNHIKMVNPTKSKFKLNDKVRISKHKQTFEKGYTPNYTTEIFSIDKILLTNPITYLLKDYRNNRIKGCFYQQELLKVKHDDIYLVEKVLKKRGNKYYVKWLGFDDSHNSWVNKQDI